MLFKCKSLSGFLCYLIWPVRVTSEIFLLLKSKIMVYAFFPGMDSSVILKFVPKSTSTRGIWTSLVKIFLSLLYLKVNVASCCFTPGKYNVIWLFATMESVWTFFKRRIKKGSTGNYITLKI